MKATLQSMMVEKATFRYFAQHLSARSPAVFCDPNHLTVQARLAGSSSCSIMISSGVDLCSTRC